MSLSHTELSETVLNLNEITKVFPGVKALSGVSFSLKKGEVRALVGENGAGKSTLMKVLSGAYEADGGTIQVFGEDIDRPTPAGMIERGVAVIYQELSQAHHLSVAENVLMGQLPKKGMLVDWAEANRQTSEVFARLGFEIDPKVKIGALSVAKRQMVEIAKALARKAQIIVLDEPSAVLAQAEIDQLFKIIKQLSEEDGVSFVYISHRLREVFEIGDTVTILRDGQLVQNTNASEMTTDGLINAMVGRDVGDIFPQRTPKIGDDALVVSDLSAEGLEKASLSVKQGEIVGLFGLAGAGRTELLRAIYGADPRLSGTVLAEGTEYNNASPRAGIAKGLGLVPEDRKTEGLFLIQGVGFNMMSASLAKIIKRGLISLKEEASIVASLIKRLRIKTPSADTAVMTLSGGNQQKCVIARLVSADCRIFLADEPTRGVDVGAKREIYDLLVELAETKRLAVLIASSELPEILGLCDRIYVMREGRIVTELLTKETTEEEVMSFAALK